MFSSSIQGQLAQARVEELHRFAHTSNRGVAASLSTRIKDTLSRVFDGGGLVSGDDLAAIHGVQFVGHPAAHRSRQS
jgi:hypothetical protein